MPAVRQSLLPEWKYALLKWPIEHARHNQKPLLCTRSNHLNLNQAFFVKSIRRGICLGCQKSCFYKGIFDLRKRSYAEILNRIKENLIS